MYSPWRCETVNHEINFSKIRFDQVDGLFHDLVRERIAINALRVQSFCVRHLFKRRVLYQPGDAGRPGSAGFSKNTPIVAAFEPNALVMREASPNPVEAPITSTFFGPLIGTLCLDMVYLAGQHFAHSLSDERVRQINPRTFGVMIMPGFYDFLIGYKINQSKGKVISFLGHLRSSIFRRHSAAVHHGVHGETLRNTHRGACILRLSEKSGAKALCEVFKLRTHHGPPWRALAARAGAS